MKTSIKQIGGLVNALIFALALDLDGYEVEVTERYVIWRQ